MGDAEVAAAALDIGPTEPAPYNRDAISAGGEVRTRIRSIMWERVAIVRDHAGLSSALAEFD